MDHAPPEKISKTIWQLSPTFQLDFYINFTVLRVVLTQVATYTDYHVVCRELMNF